MKILLEVLNNKKVQKIPFWYMRQAGRYLPEYIQTKGNLDFLELSLNIEKAIEISIQPYIRFKMDGIILFADILTPLHGIGIPIQFKENIGPIIHFDIFNKNDINKLKNLYPEKQVYHIKQIIKGIKEFIDQNTNKEASLIGFSGAPFTLLSYLVEKKTSRKFEKTKEFLFNFEDFYREIMEYLTKITIQYLEYQVEAGAEVVQIFDSWGGILSYHHYEEFCFPYMKKIVSHLKQKVPVIVFVGNNSHLIPLLVKMEPTCISLDWRVFDISNIPENIAIQGNMDPLVLYGSKERVQKETLFVLNTFSVRNNFIFNLGHGIYPDTPLHNVQTMVDIIRNYPLNK